MRRIVMVLTCIILFIGYASAELTVDSDKILNLSGNRTFIVGLMESCYQYADETGTNHSHYICDGANFSGGWNFDNYFRGNLSQINTFNNTGVYWTYEGVHSGDITSPQKNHPNFMGYWQEDEPPIGTEAAVSTAYNNIKANDTTHLVWLNIAKNYSNWEPYTDIISWDYYPFRECVAGACGYSVTFVPRNNDGTPKHAIYGWEWATHASGFNHTDTVTSFRNLSKPAFLILQGVGTERNETVGAYTERYLVTTKQEARTQAYTAVTMNSSGVAWWPGDYLMNMGTEPGEPTYKQIGLNSNQTVFNYVKAVGAELISLNSILVLPTVNYSWDYDRDDAVNFTNNPAVTLASHNFKSFNYIMKRSSTSTFLIVVNKNSSSVTTDINISGLSGSFTATTLGNWTDGGSQAPGRIISVTNGVFTDSFDAYAAHVYEIEMNATADTFDVWLDNVDLGADTTNLFYNFTALTPNTTYNISIRTHNLTYDSYSTWVNQTTTTNASVFIPPAPVWVSNNTGYYWANHTWQAGAGNGTDSYNISVNGTWYNGTSTSFNSSLLPLNWSNITVWAWNNTGYMSATNITNNSQAPASPSYIPPVPTWVSNITGSYWVNHTWSAGSGNITNSYNVSVNGTWYNSTATFFNSSLVPAGCSNITVWAYNNTGVTSATNITNNSCVPASPTYAPSITSYSPADLTPSYSIGALATFEAGSNQSVSWTWTGATEGAGDGTTNSTATQTWLTAGAKTVTVTCSNANGSCGTIQWDVTVDPDPALGYNISGYVTYINTSPVEGARIRVWGAENTSDVNGYYALYGLSSGNYTILFEKDYYYDGVARIVLTDNATQNYTFVSKVHVSTPGFTGILTLFGILFTVALYRHRNH